MKDINIERDIWDLQRYKFCKEIHREKQEIFDDVAVWCNSSQCSSSYFKDHDSSRPNTHKKFQQKNEKFCKNENESRKRLRDRKRERER